MIFLAKPIRATPTLTGEDALRFVANMKKRDKANRLSPADALLIRIMRRNEKTFSV